MIKFSDTYFNVKDTLECGQVFRFTPYKNGYVVYSKDKCAYVYNQDGYAYVETDDEEYFYNYFDLNTDYNEIYNKALSYNIDFLTKSANMGKGIRILRQDSEEMTYSFIVSQNNNIPRIKGIIERMCKALGERKTSAFGDYYAFPKSNVMATKSVEFYKSMGLGYRDKFICDLAKSINNGLKIESLKGLNAEELRTELLKINGVGPKVADCIGLFGFYKTASFPVDTWVEKIYVENFNGTLKDRKKITRYFVDTFKEYSGYIQQYMFYNKRSE